MLILGIDTTGFSSSISLVEDGQKVIFNNVSPPYKIEKGWGDIPYALPAFHREYVLDNMNKILEEHNISYSEIDAIAVSANSGIFGCITTGVTIAYCLGAQNNVPVVEVDHILAHVYSTYLERNVKDFRYPILNFSSSGSHTDFSLINSIDSYELLADKTLVEHNNGVGYFVGIGKYFYRISVLLGVVNKTNKDWRKIFEYMDEGNEDAYDLFKYHKMFFNFDYSDLFVGVKNELLKIKSGPKKEAQIKDLAASFRKVVFDNLTDEIIMLAKKRGVQEIHLTGGLSDNKYFQKKLEKEIKIFLPNVNFRFPVKGEYRLDNAAMIACLAYYQKKHKIDFKNFKPIITR